MPSIENCAADDLPKMWHHKVGENSMLISIRDPGSWLPRIGHKFKEVHYFEFLDVEEEDFVLEESMKCSQEQANQIVGLLRRALNENMRVIVHCYAGVSRSGAVVEIAQEMGFEPIDKYRCPNKLVMNKMRIALNSVL